MECVLHIGRSLTPHRANAPPAIVSFLFVAIFEPAASPPRNRFSSMQTGAEGSASALDERPNGGKHSEKQVRLRSEEHTSELQSLMRISYAVFCLKKKKQSK